MPRYVSDALALGLTVAVAQGTVLGYFVIPRVRGVSVLWLMVASILVVRPFSWPPNPPANLSHGTLRT